ncbi:hypothetical protein D3C83_61410 [compost metagenome]
MVAAVVLPYSSMLMITFSSGMPMRSAADMMMRLLAWCDTNSERSSPVRLFLFNSRSQISPVLRTANLNTVWPSCFT